LDSGAGLANATLQQRLTAVRLFYDYLIEEGMRTDNPVGRGRYTPGKGFGGARDRGLIPRYRKLPWIPSDKQAVLDREATQIAFARNAPQPPKGGIGPPPNVQPVPGRLLGTRIPAGQGTILETGFSPLGSAFEGENRWYEQVGSEDLAVYAGALRSDPTQGLLVVWMSKIRTGKDGS